MKTSKKRLTEILDQIESDVVPALKMPAHLSQWEADKNRAALTDEHEASIMAGEMARYWLGTIRNSLPIA